MKQGNGIRNTYLSICRLSVLACLIAIPAFLLTSCAKNEEEVVKEIVRPVKTFPVKTSARFEGLRLPGRVRAVQRVNLAFKQVGGRLIQLPIEGREGELVQKGDLLARIDPRDFRVNLREAEGRLKEAEAALKLAESEYQRVKRIMEKDPGAVSQAMVDRKREAGVQARGRLKSFQAAVDDARNRLNDTHLRAPFTGVIARRYVDNFQEVKPKQPIASLQDISFVEILVDVPETVMAGAKANGEDGLEAVAIFPTAPEKQFPLNLKETASEADPATQTYQAVLDMPQPQDLNVLPGMTATVLASTTEERIHRSSIIIPAIAVVAGPEGKYHVWIVDTLSMTAHKRAVTVGPLTGSDRITILDGLQQGNEIVVAGILQLREGMKVSRWNQP